MSKVKENVLKTENSTKIVYDMVYNTFDKTKKMVYNNIYLGYKEIKNGKERNIKIDTRE